MRTSKGRFAVLAVADWSGEWAWGNYPSKEAAERDCAGIAAMGRHYSRVLIDPTTRTEAPPGAWLIIWKDEA